jgi:exonuclease III
MRLISWNMAGAGFHTASSHQDAWHWLTKECDFDVAMLQESTPPQWVFDEFSVVIHNPKYPQKGQRWGTSIICRQEIYSQYVPEPEEPWLEKIRGAVSIAEPNDPEGIWLVNIHSNAYSLPKSILASLDDMAVPHCHPQKIWEVEVAAHFLEPLLKGKRFVFGGDLNSGYLFDVVNHYENNKIMFENMRKQGYIDLRLAHSDVEQQTYFKKGKGPFQLDHLYGDTDTAGHTTRWEVLAHVARDLELSDHAPVIVEIL